MNVNELIAQRGEDREVVVQRALQCKTTADLLELAKLNKIELSEQQADQLLGLMQPAAGALSDNELDAVTGGSDKNREPCEWCGATKGVCACALRYGE
jgi:hypothetical protein